MPQCTVNPDERAEGLRNGLGCFEAGRLKIRKLTSLEYSASSSGTRLTLPPLSPEFVTQFTPSDVVVRCKGNYLLDNIIVYLNPTTTYTQLKHPRCRQHQSDLCTTTQRDHQDLGEQRLTASENTPHRHHLLNKQSPRHRLYPRHPSKSRLIETI